MWGGYAPKVCPCRIDHRPAVHRLNRHHVIPESWGGPSTYDNLLDICPTTHVNTHMLIDLYKKAMGKPPTDVVSSFSFLERRLAQFAWDHRPSDNPPITSRVA